MMELKKDNIQDAYDAMFAEVLNKEYNEEQHDGGIGRLYKDPKELFITLPALHNTCF